MAKYNTIFHQILPFFEINRLNRLSVEIIADKYVKRFFNKYLFITLVYGMLARKWSLRLIEHSLNSQTALRKMIRMPSVHRTTISKALENRSVEVFRQHYFFLLDKYQNDFFKLKKCGNGLTIIDASVIRLPQQLCYWADFERGLKGIKIHIVMESSLSIPEFQQLTIGNDQEITVARKILDKFPEDRILVFDRAYFAWDFFRDLCHRRIGFVIPAKKNVKFKVVSEISQEKLPDDVLADEIVAFTSREAKTFGKKLRRIVYRNPDNGKEWVYFTNCMELDSETVIEIYRQRWKIEIFFRWIKQNLKINSFWGTSRNAVELQIWVALTVYLVMLYLSMRSKWSNQKSPYYFYHYVRDKLFERTKLYIFNVISIT